MAAKKNVNQVRFKTLASDRPSALGDGDQRLIKAQMVLRKVFSPGTPIIDVNHFAGRVGELSRAVSAIENGQVHLVIHGKRGLGKTSFSNALIKLARDANYMICEGACSRESTFSEVFRTFLKDIPLLFDRETVTRHEGRETQGSFADLLPEGDFTPKELTEVMVRLTSTRALLVLDEVDRNQVDGFKNQLQETIKNFSDRGVRAHMVLIGATDTVDELLGLNESVRRNITGIPIKVFTAEELVEMFEIGEEASGIHFPNPIRARISQLCRNVPHSSRMLCLYAAQSAANRGDWSVEEQDLDIAMLQAIMDTETLLDNDLLNIIHSSHGTALGELLGDVARAKNNVNSEFTAEQVASAHNQVSETQSAAFTMGSRLVMLCKTNPPILARRDYQGKTLYKFVDPTVGMYLRLLEAKGKD